MRFILFGIDDFGKICLKYKEDPVRQLVKKTIVSIKEKEDDTFVIYTLENGNVIEKYETCLETRKILKIEGLTVRLNSKIKRIEATSNKGFHAIGETGELL